LFINGYSVQIMKKIILHEEDPSLPEWNDWGTLLIDGLKLYGAILIYELPAILLLVGGYFLMFVLNIGFTFAAIPLSINSSDPSTAPLLPVFGSMLGTIGGMVVVMLGFFLILVTMVFIPPAVGNMIAKGEFSAAFRVKEWWPVFKANLSGYLLALVISLGLFSVFYMLLMVFYMTIVLCFLLPVISAAAGYVMGLIAYALFAVAYRDGTRKLAIAATPE
jgi:hypothetical protein